jgi:hypothetical protein
MWKIDSLFETLQDAINKYNEEYIIDNEKNALDEKIDEIMEILSLTGEEATKMVKDPAKLNDIMHDFNKKRVKLMEILWSTKESEPLAGELVKHLAKEATAAPAIITHGVEKLRKYLRDYNLNLKSDLKTTFEMIADRNLTEIFDKGTFFAKGVLNSEFLSTIELDGGPIEILVKPAANVKHKSGKMTPNVGNYRHRRINIAYYNLARYLNFKITVKAALGIFDGEEVLLMRKAAGEVGHKAKDGPVWPCLPSIKGVYPNSRRDCKIDLLDPFLQEQCMEAAALDAIFGVSDRHSKNFNISFDGGQQKIRLFDHDYGIGPGSVYSNYKDACPWMTEKIRSALLTLNEDIVRELTAGLLTTNQLSILIDRVTKIVDYAKTCNVVDRRDLGLDSLLAVLLRKNSKGETVFRGKLEKAGYINPLVSLVSPRVKHFKITPEQYIERIMNTDETAPNFQLA